jgi:hypothetical protein
MAHDIGTRLGRYEIHSKRAMGEVYLAEDKDIQATIGLVK